MEKDNEEEKFKRYLRMLNEENSIDKKEEAMLGLLGLYYKQQTEIEELKEKEKNLLKQLKDSEKELLEVTQNVASKDKVEELKEKNASLQKEIKLMKSININDNYINKDKIKKLKEYYEDSLQYAENEIESNNIFISIKNLEKLLEE